MSSATYEDELACESYKRKILQSRGTRPTHLAAIEREAQVMRERVRYRASLESLKHAITELLPEPFQYSGYSTKVKAMILSYAAPDLPPAQDWNPWGERMQAGSEKYRTAMCMIDAGDILENRSDDFW
tara:strand:+ start:679 stop:1062 length:384 start_codon:yes stop_codon:yes gene_type:complete